MGHGGSHQSCHHGQGWLLLPLDLRTDTNHYRHCQLHRAHLRSPSRHSHEWQEPWGGRLDLGKAGLLAVSPPVLLLRLARVRSKWLPGEAWGLSSLHSPYL